MIHTRLTTTKIARPRRRTPAGRPATRPGGVPTDNGRRTTDRRGFTLIELLVVIVVLGVLMALLLPAINGALRRGREAAVSAEINQLAQALEQFKSKYGDYPPSRFLAVENGNYSTYLNDTTTLQGGTLTDPLSPGNGDINLGQLAQRSVRALRTFWPRVSTTGLPSGVWYDFNGTGGTGPDNPYILHGHECLVFFLGGVPLVDGTGGWSTTGFGKDPTNPFTNSVVGNTMYNANRQPPMFEFNPGRLFPDLTNTSLGGVNPGIPAYYDTLNNGPPSTAGPINFYVYFSAYGSGNYDPNDVNFITETDGSGNGPIGTYSYVSYPITGNTNTPPIAISASPNPYTSSSTESSSGTVTYQKPQTYQLISAGGDGFYGVGGQYVQQTQSATQPLPFSGNTTVNWTSISNYGSSAPSLETSMTAPDLNLRQRESDNLTNFKAGPLQ